MTPFSADLLAWYDAHRRTLPWRDAGVSPYRTWVSEVMLQQTRVETVKPYFERWMARFPTVDALAAAPLDEVLSLWSGLGYYSRARNLHRAAQQVVVDGSFPTTVVGLRTLPGVGEYIAGAVGSIALGLDVPAVDGNLERVLARVHQHLGSRREVIALAKALLPAGRAGDFNQALMDVGSGVCRPRNPDCPACPVSAHCAGLRSGDPLRYPAAKKKRVVPERTAVAGVWTRGRTLLLARRPAEGLFGGLYELPGGMVPDGQTPEDALVTFGADRLGVTWAAGAHLGTVRHTLTHMRITTHVMVAAALGDPTSNHYTALTWVDPDAPGGIGLSTLARKALKLARPALVTKRPVRRD